MHNAKNECHLKPSLIDLIFLKNQITENAINKTKIFWKLCKPFFTEKGFHYKQKFTLKTERGVKSSETTTANIFNNCFVNIAKSLKISA